jgi:hypothetical protein
MSAYITMKCRICRATYTTPVLGDGRHSVLCPAGHMSTETIRPTPDRLSGCTCGGIGDTGAHFRGCPWGRSR